MQNTINLTSGTLPVLQQIMKKYRQRKLSLLKSISSNHYMLLDRAQGQAVFNLPIRYQINEHYGINNWGILTSFTHLILTKHQIQILSSYIKASVQHSLPKDMNDFFYLTNLNNSSNKILLTNWNNFKSYVNWKNNSFVKFFTRSNNDYYQSNFRYLHS